MALLLVDRNSRDSRSSIMMYELWDAASLRFLSPYRIGSEGHFTLVLQLPHLSFSFDCEDKLRSRRNYKTLILGPEYEYCGCTHFLLPC